jgi:RNA methyltransferase, TrmH family
MKENDPTQLVSSIRHPLLDLALRLRSRPCRDHHKLVFVEGVRFVLAAEQAGCSFHALVVSPRLLRSSAGRQSLKRLQSLGVVSLGVTAEAFRQISGARRASGIAAIVRQRWVPLSHVTEREGRTWLALRRIDAPGNLGTLLRTAEATQTPGLILLGSRVDPFDPDVVRASMGAVFRMAFVRTTHRALDRWRRLHRGWRLVGAMAEGAAVYPACDLSGPSVLLLGHERSGLTEEERSLCDATVRISMGGRLSSLNVGVAASVLLYEAWRQRGGF